MNVIFLDIDGVLNGTHSTRENINLSLKGINVPNIDEDKIILLSQITHKYNCKVVLSSSWKLDKIVYDKEKDEFILNKNLSYLLELFRKYDIEFLGYTKDIPKKGEVHGQRMWKDNDIRLYLWEHPEIEHFIIIDDENYDIELLARYLVQTEDNSTCKEDEGLTEKHIEEIGKRLTLTHKYHKNINIK